MLYLYQDLLKGGVGEAYVFKTFEVVIFFWLELPEKQLQLFYTHQKSKDIYLIIGLIATCQLFARWIIYMSKLKHM